MGSNVGERGVCSRRGEKRKAEGTETLSPGLEAITRHPWGEDHEGAQDMGWLKRRETENKENEYPHGEKKQKDGEG